MKAWTMPNLNERAIFFLHSRIFQSFTVKFLYVFNFNNAIFGIRIFRTINRTGDFTHVQLAKSVRPVKGIDLLRCSEAFFNDSIHPTILVQLQQNDNIKLNENSVCN